jgi:hypothetical protein
VEKLCHPFRVGWGDHPFFYKYIIPSGFFDFWDECHLAERINYPFVLIILSSLRDFRFWVKRHLARRIHFGYGSIIMVSLRDFRFYAENPIFDGKIRFL